MKLIAKAQKGREFFHSRENAFFAPNSSANKICKMMNDAKFRLQNENEVWHVYDYDWTQEDYVTHRLSIYRGIVKLKALWKQHFIGKGKFMYRVEWLNDNGDTCIKSRFETSEEAHEWIRKHHFKKFAFPMVFYDGE